MILALRTVWLILKSMALMHLILLVGVLWGALVVICFVVQLPMALIAWVRLPR